jgi:hypothetical protein
MAYTFCLDNAGGRLFRNHLTFATTIRAAKSAFRNSFGVRSYREPSPARPSESQECAGANQAASAVQSENHRHHACTSRGAESMRFRSEGTWRQTLAKGLNEPGQFEHGATRSIIVRLPGADAINPLAGIVTKTVFTGQYLPLRGSRIQ